MRLSFKVEVQPTPTQRRALMQHAGNARWAYNWGLHQKQAAWAVRKKALDEGALPKDAPKVPTAIDLHKALNVLKRASVEDGGVPWMYAASKCAPQEALRNLDKAFQNFFRRVKKGETPGFPKFKSRNKGIGGFRLTGSIKVNVRSIKLPTIGRVRLKPGEMGYVPSTLYSQVSVSEQAGRWFVSVLGPDVGEPSPHGSPAIGVDLGVARLATTSNGEVIENPRALAAGLRKIKHLQRSVARKQRGSSNRRKARAQLARAFRRVSNVRKDALHKATTILTKNHSRIVIEDLRVKNMTKSGKGRRKTGLNRALLDASFGEFRRQLEYKAKIYGCDVTAVPPHYTSQRCSTCGHTEKDNRRSQARFKCLKCGFEMNADENAAINILVAGSCPETLNACGAGHKQGAPCAP